MRFQNTKTLLAAAVVLSMAFSSAQATAQSKKAKPASKPTPTQEPKSESDKVDISDIENKYWAPKDTDFSVVQNRTYTKEGRFALALQGGLLLNDNYSDGFVYGGTANYFFSERYGIEATYMAADLSDNEPTKQLVDFGGGIYPDFGRMKEYYNVGFNWVPFYAKMSVLGKKIMYFDMAFTPAVGMMSYEQVTQNSTIGKSAFTYGFDVTQYYFLSPNFSIRLDLRNRWFEEDVAKYYTSGGLQEGQTFRSKTTHYMQLIFGLNYFF